MIDPVLKIRTTHTGSLPRPERLTALYARRARGEAVDETEIAAAGLEALRWSVGKQIEVGLDVINNGEQQRESFALHMRYRLTGLADGGSRLPLADIEKYPEYKAAQQAVAAVKPSVSNREYIPRATAPVAYINRGEIDTECASFRTVLAASGRRPAEAFLTAPSPGIVAAIIKNEFYDSTERYLEALSRALQIEYEAIIASGFILQIDAPDLGLERHCLYQHRPLGDFIHFVEIAVEAINRALVNIPRDRVRLHVCFGNYEGPHDCDVPLADVLPVITRVDAQALVLPFANPRHAHEHRYVTSKAVGDDRIIVAGVIDTLTNIVEHPEVVSERIRNVARALGDPRRVMAGTDCGFDTAAGMGRVTSDVAWAKLRALCEGAALASQALA